MHRHVVRLLFPVDVGQYLQVVGESTEPGRDGGQPPPGAVCTPIFIAAAWGRAHGRRLSLTGGTRAKETPQTYPKQVHTHFLLVVSGESDKKEAFLCGLIYSGRRLLMWLVGWGMKRWRLTDAFHTKQNKTSEHFIHSQAKPTNIHVRVLASVNNQTLSPKTSVLPCSETFLNPPCVVLVHENKVAELVATRAVAYLAFFAFSLSH